MQSRLLWAAKVKSRQRAVNVKQVLMADLGRRGFEGTIYYWLVSQKKCIKQAQLEGENVQCKDGSWLKACEKQQQRGRMLHDNSLCSTPVTEKHICTTFTSSSMSACVLCSPRWLRLNGKGELKVAGRLHLHLILRRVSEDLLDR